MTSRQWSDYGGLALSSADLNGIEHDLDIRPQQWQAYTAYTLGQIIVNPSGDVVTVTTAHTSTGAYAAANFGISSTYVATSKVGQANGVAALDGNGDVPAAQIPDLFYNKTLTFLPTAAHDLNTYLTPGNYHQNANTGASTGTNYPIAQAGLLRVFQTPGTGTAFTYQFYTAYEGANRQFWRTQYGATWSAWKEVADVDGMAATYVAASTKGAANGVATLDSGSHVPSAQLPAASSTVAGSMSTADKVKLDASTSSPTANALVRRDANGRAQVAGPSVAADIATKSYVDTSIAAIPPAANPDYGYVYLGFPGNGAYLEKAQILFSPDGKSVAPGANNPVYTDPNTGGSFRDPSLLRIGSAWFAAYTVNNGNSKNFAVIKSTDLTHWTQVALVDVSAATSLNQAWAPELVADTNGDIYAFFTNVTATNAQSIWYVKATDPTGLTTWAAPVAMAWTTNPGNIWDATFIHSGSTWYQFYAFGGYIQRATCSTLTGTWTTDKTADWAGWRAAMPANSNLEGPAILLAGSTYRIYFDPYVGTSAPYSQPGYYYSESSDLLTWTAPVLVAKANSFPAGSVLRHGAWVHLADDASRNAAIAAVTGKAQLQHAEFTGSFSISTGTVTAVTGQTITTNSNHDQFVSNDGSGKFTFLAAGEYVVSADFRVTAGTGVTRSFAQMSNNGNTSVYQRTPGGVEDQFSLLIPSFKATAGLQVLIQAFLSFTGPGTLQATIRFTRTSW